MERAHRGEAPSRLFSRVSASERRRIVADFRRSGLIQAKFARSVGISGQTLSRWLSKSGDKETEGALASQRVAIQVFDPEASSRAVFELAFGSKISLRVPAGFDEGELRRLVAILRESC